VIMSRRKVSRLIPAQATTDGAGVKLKRSLGNSATNKHDPFLMLDEFFSDQPADYLGGFPSHPHRGFETVTYMLEGHMLHEDHLGNKGHLRDGGLQWMTAGRGVIHSEMPQQEAGRMRGFQLWINLPAAEKMRPASYRDVPTEDIPRLQLGEQGEAILLAGRSHIDGQLATGFINGIDGQTLSTDPIYIDLRLAAGQSTTVSLPETHNALIYVYEGSISIDEEAVPNNFSALLSGGEELTINAYQRAQLLVLAAKAIGEPIVQYGPFVMNNNAEIDQAMRDYRDGTLTIAAG
jgi:redox-sensitive bicupin YhaK (pirin superfamily)